MSCKTSRTWIGGVVSSILSQSATQADENCESTTASHSTDANIDGAAIYCIIGKLQRIHLTLTIIQGF